MHKPKRMNSIRRYLVLRLALGIFGTSLMVAVTLYVMAKGEVNELYDAHLKQIARTLRIQSLLPDSRPDNDAMWVTDSTKSRPLKEEDYLIQLWARDGKLLYSSYPAVTFPLQHSQKILTTSFEGEQWRSFSTKAENGFIQVAQPVQTRADMLADVSLRLLIPLLLQIPLLGALIWWIVRRSLQPLNDISNAIGERVPEALAPLESTRIPREVQPLVRALNLLLHRLGDALEAQRRFTADAAHELRTPLTALQLQLEVLRRSDEPAMRGQAMDSLGAGIRRSIHMVHQLLTMARIDPRRMPQTQATIDLGAIARASVELHAPLATEKGIDLGLVGEQALPIAGDADTLPFLINNLIDNAIRYTPPGGRVDVVVGREAARPVLRVRDTGPGIPEIEQERVFDRFYRIVGTQQQGTGLGLAIAKHVAQRHAARIRLESDTGGTCFSVLFPAQIG